MVSLDFGSENFDQTRPSLIDILSGFWTPRLYLGKGLCYSFEPRLNGLDSMPVISMDEMLSMELTFNVSICIDKSII